MKHILNIKYIKLNIFKTFKNTSKKLQEKGYTFYDPCKNQIIFTEDKFCYLLYDKKTILVCDKRKIFYFMPKCSKSFVKENLKKFIL